MKYVLNNEYGGFEIPNEILNKVDTDNWKQFDDSYEVRTNPNLIDWVENHKEETDLRVIEIPEEATDWELNEYDGLETVTAVINGKLVGIYAED